MRSSGTAIRVFFVAAILGAAASPAAALDGYWHGVIDGVWGKGNTGGVSNWYTQAPPNGSAQNVPNGVARFHAGALRVGITVNDHRAIAALNFPNGAPKYTFLVNTSGQLTVNGGGMIISTTNNPVFVIRRGEMFFTGIARADSALFEVEGVSSVKGELIFRNSSRGDTAEVTNKAYGVTVFENTANADRMTILNLNNGVTEFRGDSSGGNAILETEIGGKVDFCKSRRNLAITSGFLENAGTTNIGPCPVSLRGNFTQKTTGAISFDLGNLTVGGAARLAGKLIFDANRHGVGHRARIIQATGSLSGKFTSVQGLNLVANTKLRVDYVGKQVFVAIVAK